jgi:hypothetical protein
MTIEVFTRVFGVLAVQLRAQATDPQQTNREIRAYYAALKDLDLEFIQMAAQELAKTAEWFPKSSEWRDTAKAIERRRSFALADTLRQLHRHGVEICAGCGDTGWYLDAENNAKPCDCRKLRRLEILGRRPMPELKALLP